MSTLAQRRMPVDEFLAWAEGREGRRELYNGVPYETPPPVVHHRRQPDGTIQRSVVHQGILALSQPGIELAVAELLAVA